MTITWNDVIQMRELAGPASFPFMFLGWVFSNFWQVGLGFIIGTILARLNSKPKIKTIDKAWEGRK